MLRSCDGPGVMLLMDLARQRDGFLNFESNAEDIQTLQDLAANFPQSSMELDCQGTIQYTSGDEKQLVLEPRSPNGVRCRSAE